MPITAFHLAAWAALVIIVMLVFLVLFESGLPYRVTPPGLAVDLHQFLGLVTAVVDAQLLGRSSVEVLTDGRAVYESSSRQFAPLDTASPGTTVTPECDGRAGARTGNCFGMGSRSTRAPPR